MRALDYKPFYLNKKDYEDKVYACWLGKNIGGTMGTPYEGRRELLDISGFATPPSVVLPNDDLDLQLVWLHGMEEIGPYNMTPERLGDLWMSFINPWWNEYGIGKANMSRGLIPPLSGQYKNNWKDSNGAWIRTEIWATLLPASPDAAVKYAYYDACVDHGHGEGTYAAAFVAAIESAAFVVKDIRKLIEIGLARIPEDCRLAQTIRLVVDSYDSGKTWKETRSAVLEQNRDIGDGWFEAPSNVGYAILGILYGEGDFKKSMITAINCGDDTDCTGATVGSILGIMGGTAAIPQDWKEYLGDSISTVSISLGVFPLLTKTCTQLTQHVCKMAPHVLFANRSVVEIEDQETGDISMIEGALYSGNFREFFRQRKPYSYTVAFGHTVAEVSFEESPDIEPLKSISVNIDLVRRSVDFCNLFGEGANRGVYGNSSLYYSFRWLLPDGWSVTGPASVKMDSVSSHSKGLGSARFTLTAGENVQPVNRAVLEIAAHGTLTVGYVPVTLIG